MQSASPPPARKRAHATHPYGKKAHVTTKPYRSAIVPSYAMKSTHKKSGRTSYNRSPQLMDWIMLDNNITPIQETIKRRTARTTHLAPINPESNEQLRNFVIDANSQQKSICQNIRAQSEGPKLSELKFRLQKLTLQISGSRCLGPSGTMRPQSS
mgnify:CR=1 FL=1